MLAVSQLIAQDVRRQLKIRVQEAVQPGAIRVLVEQEINAVIVAALNAQLVSERDEILGRQPYERQPGVLARNGFKSTRVPGLWGALTLRRPAVRRGVLKLPLLDALKAAGKGLVDVLAVRFWLRGASTRAVAEELNSALGSKLHASTVSTLTNALEPTLRDWESRPIPAGICYLFVDALYLPVRRPGFTSKQALLVAIGVDDKAQRHVLGFLLGDRESQESWEALIENLLSRGLKRENLRLVVSDEHKGIEAAVTNRLGVAHQLCVVHMMRNARARVAAPDRKAFLLDMHAVYWAPSRGDARQALGALQARWGQRYPAAVRIVSQRFEDHTRFFDEPENLWALLRSTNLIERFNRELRRRLNPAGAMHSELEVQKLTWSVAEAQERRWAGKRWSVRAGGLKPHQMAYA
jgi:transposase-like protein